MVNESACVLGENRSVIRDLFEYGAMRTAQVGAENVIDYSMGNPSIPAPKEVEQAIRAVLEECSPLQIHSYTSAAGDRELRQAIAEDLNRRFGAGAEAGDFFICCGAAPALVSVFRALAVEKGEILAVAPYFPEYRPFAEEAGLGFRVVPADVPSFQINLDKLEKMVTEHTQALIINSPNNPSGVVYTRQTLTALAALLKRKADQFGHPIYIISDEPYRELAYGVEVPFLPLIYPDTVVCYSWSKSLSLPGERIGYVYVPQAAADSRILYGAVSGAARVCGHVCAPSLWQKVVARCIHLRPDLESYDRNRKALYEGLTACGYEAARPDGAFYMFVKAPGGDANAFMEKAKQKDLLVVPGDCFGCPGYFRVCYCVSFDRIQRSLPVFEALIKEA